MYPLLYLRGWNKNGRLCFLTPLNTYMAREEQIKLHCSKARKKYPTNDKERWLPLRVRHHKKNWKNTGKFAYYVFQKTNSWTFPILKLFLYLKCIIFYVHSRVLFSEFSGPAIQYSSPGFRCTREGYNFNRRKTRERWRFLSYKAQGLVSENKSVWYIGKEQ